MRETRTSGSEGGVKQTNASSLPLSLENRDRLDFLTQRERAINGAAIRIRNEEKWGL